MPENDRPPGELDALPSPEDVDAEAQRGLGEDFEKGAARLRQRFALRNSEPLMDWQGAVDGPKEVTTQPGLGPGVPPGSTLPPTEFERAESEGKARLGAYRREAEAKLAKLTPGSKEATALIIEMRRRGIEPKVRLTLVAETARDGFVASVAASAHAADLASSRAATRRTRGQAAVAGAAVLCVLAGWLIARSSDDAEGRTPAGSSQPAVEASPTAEPTVGSTTMAAAAAASQTAISAAPASSVAITTGPRGPIARASDASAPTARTAPPGTTGPASTSPAKTSSAFDTGNWNLDPKKKP